MSLITREDQQFAITERNPPHYFEVRNEWGDRYIHCGSERDAIDACHRNPGYTYVKKYLPQTPQTVDVSSTRVASDLELSSQNILPDTQQEPFNP